MRAEKAVIQGVNTNGISHICVVYNYRREIKVNGGVHDRSVLSALIINLIIWCRETIDTRLKRAIKVEPEKLDVVVSF